MAITDATSVIIGSELSLSERKSLIDGFVNYIEEMSESGRSVIAIAVALEQTLEPAWSQRSGL